MRPHKPTAKSKNVSRHRVQIRLQDGLGWLRGYPAGPVAAGRIDWRCVPAPDAGRPIERLVVDGRLLGKAAYRRDELFAKYPRCAPAGRR